MIDGVVNVLKPAGMTSHDVVGRLRRIYQTKKVGHTGTLDPDAVGVLPVCIGQATRLAEYFTEKEKCYRAIMRFGMETTTQDQSGECLCTALVPELDKAAFVALLQEQFLGEIRQVPPMYSAIKKDGQPLYKLARQGVTVEVESRTAVIHRIDVLMYNRESAMLEVTCGKGTYIRTLCQDIGRACGSRAYMGYLMRTASGSFTIDQAIPLEKLAASDNPGQYVVPMVEALHTMATLLVEQEQNRMRILNGLPQRMAGVKAFAQGTIVKAVTPEQELLAIGKIDEEYFKPDKVFKRGE